MAFEQPLFVELDFDSVNKHGEFICGDAFSFEKYPERERVIGVLSDGLGSGVKANILASMTTRMALRFAASDLDFLHSAEIMMNALPVCQVRRIAYATFSIVLCELNGHTRIIEMGNPPFFLVRQGKAVVPPYTEMPSEQLIDRTTRFYDIETQPEDRIVIFSDGVTHAGIGTPAYPLGWREEGCQRFVEARLREKPDISARQLVKDIIREALLKEPDGKAGDDTSCAVLYVRRPRHLLLMSGPPFRKEQDRWCAQFFKNFEGRRIISGGTTANIISRELKRDIETDLRSAGDLPPVSRMEGADLITEGILTLTRAANYLESGIPTNTNNAAVQVCELLLESDIVHLMVGTKINEAHHDPKFPVDLEIRRNVVKRLATVLETRYLKEVKVQYV